MEVARDWRNTGVTPDLENSTVRILRESELQEMQKVAPWVAAIARQQAEEARASINRTKQALEVMSSIVSPRRNPPRTQKLLLWKTGHR